MNSRVFLIVAACVAALVIGLGAVKVLSGSNDSGTSQAVAPAGATQGLSGQEPPGDLTSCLKEQGADLPSGMPSQGKQPSSQNLKAFEACQQYLPAGTAPPGQMPIPGG